MDQRPSLVFMHKRGQCALSWQLSNLQERLKMEKQPCFWGSFGTSFPDGNHSIRNLLQKCVVSWAQKHQSAISLRDGLLESHTQGPFTRTRGLLPRLKSSVQFSCSVASDSLWPHGLQQSRPPCPSPSPRVYSDSCPLNRWCHPTISSSVLPFSSRPH